MAAVNFELKHYQVQTLRTFRAYLRKANTMGADVGFYSLTKRAYQAAPILDPGTPYICLRVPTGGGKTVIAAHSVGIAAEEFLQTDAPMVLWLVPSSTILEQTLAALKNLEHPYRAALAQTFGRNVSVMTLQEALYMNPAASEGDCCIIVATIQSFRVEDKEGRKVYEDAGALMDHFSGLTEERLATLERRENGEALSSLANVLRLHRPMVIIDEAHNARTPLSFETLSRLAPSLIVEFTATPEIVHKPEKNKFASNILAHVSAAELKAEEMIKLPIRLRTREDWRLVVGDALDAQVMLEEKAAEEERRTGEYIRPVILFQAQSKLKTDPNRLTVGVLKTHLMEDKGIPENQIAIATGSTREIDGLDLFDSNCPIRFIITVQALKEGWDFSFAYVLCSVAQISSGRAVEQLLGRILRMPRAKRKTIDDLNRAYAFVASRSFQQAADSLKDGLVENGFERIEAERLIKTEADFGFEEGSEAFEHESEPLAQTPDLTKLPATLKTRINFQPETQILKIRGSLSREDRNALHLALAPIEGASWVVDKLYLKSNHIPVSEESLNKVKPPFLVPRLGIFKQGELQLFTTDHFLDLPWNLAECDADGILDLFSLAATDAKEGDVDISDKGKVEISFIDNIHDQLEMAIREPDFTLPRLVNWIDRGIKHRDVTKPAAKIFISKVLEMLMATQNYSLDELARHKYRLRRAVATQIDDLRQEREQGNFNALFSVDTEQFKTSSDLAFAFDEQLYAPGAPYRGGTVFNKAYFHPGDLKAEGEEFECACHIDRLDAVQYWVRNLERKPNAFWLQLPSGKFYPDFVCMLKDGRKLIVEYKGAHLYTDAEDKRRIGDLWADASGGECLFTMPTERNYATIDRVIA